ncbi:MAG: hypothetical protein ABI303_02810 [Candidatus Saccharimonas sp.]
MNKLKAFLLAIVAVTTLGLAVAPTAGAVTCTDAKDCISNGVDAVGSTGGPTDVGAIVKNIVNLMLFALGAISVIMIVIGGIKYTVSNGDSSQLTSAKNTILYSVVGLVIAAAAYAIVNFVVKQF